MNKLVLPTLLALTVVAGCGQAPTVGTEGGSATPPAPAALSDADKAKIQESTDKFVAAFNAGDFDGMTACYTAEGVLMPPNNPAVTGHKAIKDYIGTMPKVKEFSIKNEKIEGAGDRAIVYGTFAITFVMPNAVEMKDKGKFIEVREKQADGSWLMSHDMFSSDMPAGGPAPAAAAK